MTDPSGNPTSTTVYATYSSGARGGNDGDLEGMLTYQGGQQEGQENAADLVDQDYYRYYQPGDLNGYAGALEYVLTDASLEGLEHDDPSVNPGDKGFGAELDELSGTMVASYANYYFQYNANHQLSEEVTQGSGCSIARAGHGELPVRNQRQPLRREQLDLRDHRD